MIKDDNYYMTIALKEANKALLENEIPVGAVIVNNKTHSIVSKAHKKKEKTKDVTGHAEIIAIRKASKKENNWRLENHTIYVTLEPCIMCAEAILQARFERVVFSNVDSLMGGFGGKIDLTKYQANNLTIKNGVLSKKSKIILDEFFSNKRK